MLKISFSFFIFLKVSAFILLFFAGCYSIKVIVVVIYLLGGRGLVNLGLRGG